MREKIMSRQNANFSRSQTAHYLSRDKANTAASMSYRYDEGALSLDESLMFFDLVFKAGMNDQKMKDLLTFVRAL
jgi:hypothetical protein